MSGLSRIGVAIDSGLLDKFDRLIGQRGYTNRSEAFRDLIRDQLVERTWESPESVVVGTVTLVYDHHVRLLNEKLTSIQHDHHDAILWTLHVHLDHDNCLEVLVVRGRAPPTPRDNYRDPGARAASKGSRSEERRVGKECRSRW